MTGNGTHSTTPKHTDVMSVVRERDSLCRRSAVVLAAFRVVVSVLFLLHGLQGFGAFGGIDGHGMAAPLFVWPIWWAGVIEVVGAVLVLVGIAARPAALICSGAMAYAYFAVHAPTGLLPMANMGEPAALYSWIFLLIATLGPGAYALGPALRRTRQGRRPA